ncbi:hypothetical protein AMECASPLE_034175 [Ameca splendens]|uniref:Tc1-like transposase DDE domain-containing protein n=1 Tax=Ameca splendens TaxID=208324 RepID=A0ABV0YU44_9TELE
MVVWVKKNIYMYFLLCEAKDEYVEKPLIPTVKYSRGSGMLGACLSSKGPGNFLRMQGIMRHRRTFLSWPSQSPDLNPVKDLRGEVRVHHPRTLDHIAKLHQEEWTKICLSMSTL